MNLPTHVRTKRHALELAHQLFPSLDVAIARVRARYPADSDNPTVRMLHRNPFSCVARDAEDNLNLFLEWLYDDEGRMRVYKRPRWWLLHTVAGNFTKLMDDNLAARSRFYSDEWWREQQNRNTSTNQYENGLGI